MNLLVAASGDQPDDFAWTVPGEIVYPGFVCDRDLDDDGSCGCARSFVGLSTGRATTVATVAELAVDGDGLAALLADHGTRARWREGIADELLAELADLGHEWPVGTPVRRHLEDYRADA